MCEQKVALYVTQQELRLLIDEIQEVALSYPSLEYADELYRYLERVRSDGR